MMTEEIKERKESNNLKDKSWELEFLEDGNMLDVITTEDAGITTK